MKQIKILWLNYEFPPLGGGAGNATYYMFKEFSKYRDITIDLVTSSTGGFRIESFSSNIKIHYLNIGKKGNLHYQTNKDLLTYSFKAYIYAKKLIKKNNYNLVQAFFGIPCGFIAMLLGIPYFVSLRGSDVPYYNSRFKFLDKIIFSRLSKHIWKNAEKVIALSNDLKLLAQKTSPSQSMEVIYNGVNIHEFKPENKKYENEINILFVGRLIERKGLIYLLEAFKAISLQYENVSLNIVGDGPLRGKYEYFVIENGLENKVRFLGRVEHNEINTVYSKSDIFVLPSLNEALGNVTHEALASGLPIITTNTGASELIEDNGIIVDKKSSKAIEEALIKLINDKQKREYMSKCSRTIAESMSWEKTTLKYYELYKEFIDRNL